MALPEVLFQGKLFRSHLKIPFGHTLSCFTRPLPHKLLALYIQEPDLSPQPNSHQAVRWTARIFVGSQCDSPLHHICALVLWCFGPQVNFVKGCAIGSITFGSIG